jgi:hypothetical protein
MITTKKAKEILSVLLMLYIITGIFVVLYQLLLWHSISKQFGYSILVAIVLLKGALLGLRRDHDERQLTKTDRLKTMRLLRICLTAFCLLLFISFLLKGYRVSAFVSFFTLLVSLYYTRLNSSIY